MPTFSDSAVVKFEVSKKEYYQIQERPVIKDVVPPGNYSLIRTTSGSILFQAKTPSEELLVPCHEFANTIIAELRSFFDARDTYASFKLPHKRGYLIHGPPGCGKSSSLRLMADDFVRTYGGIVFWADASDTPDTHYDALRQHQPNTPIMAIVEDIDTNIRSLETRWLEFLDGSEAIDNFVFVCTTNNLDAVPARLRSRPSRIDRVYEAGLPPASARDAYLARFPLPEHIRAAIASLAEGLTMSQIKEVVLATQCLGEDVRAAVARFRKLPVDVALDTVDTHSSKSLWTRLDELTSSSDDAEDDVESPFAGAQEVADGESNAGLVER